MRTQLPMDRRTSYAQEDAQLQPYVSVVRDHGGNGRRRSEERDRTLHEAQAVPQRMVSQMLELCRTGLIGFVATWIARVTVGALVIARNGMDQLLQNRLITRLLALAQLSRH